MADWTSDSDDNDKFEWDSDGEAEPSSTPATRNFDAPGPSTLSSKGWINGEAPPTSLIEGFVAMGFPKEMVVRSIKEIGNIKVISSIVMQMRCSSYSSRIRH